MAWLSGCEHRCSRALPEALAFPVPWGVNSPFAAAIAGAVRDREKRLEARRNSPAFLSTDLLSAEVRASVLNL